MRIFRKRNHLIHQVKELDKGENGILQTLFIYEEIHQKNLTPGELCAIQQLTSGRIASTLKNLEKKAFIKRMMAEDDRRKTIIKLTEKGKIVAKRIIDDIAVTMEERKLIWKIIGNGKSFFDKCKRDKINAYSAQSAFFILLSTIPFLMVFSSLLQYTPITEGTLLKMYQTALPDYISAFLISITDEVYNRSVGIISITAIVAIWSAAKGIQYMTDGLNSVNDLEENRNWFVLRLWAIVYTIVFLFAVVFTLVVLVFGNTLHDLAVEYIPLLQSLTDLIVRLRGFVLFGILFVFFDIIFTMLPNKKLTFKSQIPGAAICAVAWYVFSFALSIYVDYFNGFSMYGSLTTIALIMLWLYFCMYIMMMSAEVNVIFNESFRKWLKRDRTKKKRG